MGLTSSLDISTSHRLRQRLANGLKLPAAVLAPKHYVLVLSHMRAYTSLLCHILGSHPQISGYAESMVGYSRPFAFTRLKYRVWLSNERRLNGAFVLDKILHNGFLPDARLLNKAPVTAIFLLRPPESAIPSIVKMLSRYQPAKHAAAHGAVFAFRYYCERLEKLCEYASQLERPGLYLDAVSLIDDTPRTLGFLQYHLGLREALQESYRMFSLTGQANHGDMSPNIYTGCIVRDQPRDTHSWQLSGDFLLKANDIYHQCRAILRQHCRTF